VLAGNSVFRRGEMLEFGSADPVRFLPTGFTHFACR
jgi:hypothetical protein